MRFQSRNVFALNPRFQSRSGFALNFQPWSGGSKAATPTMTKGNPLDGGQQPLGVRPPPSLCTSTFGTWASRAHSVGKDVPGSRHKIREGWCFAGSDATCAISLPSIDRTYRRPRPLNLFFWAFTRQHRQNCQGCQHMGCSGQTVIHTCQLSN